MKKYIYLFLASVAIISFSSCEKDSTKALGTNFVSFETTSYSAGVDPGGSSTLDVNVYTTNKTGSDRTYNIIVDGSAAAANSYSVPTSVTVPGGANKGTFTVALSDTNLGIGINSLVISFEGSTDFYNGAPMEFNYVQNCTEVTGTLDITFDFYAEETGWEITDSLGGVVASKPTGSYARGQTPVSENLTLCSGRDYTLTFTDAYADGMNDGTNLGSYTLTMGGTVKVTGGGAFGASESTAFDTN